MRGLLLAFVLAQVDMYEDGTYAGRARNKLDCRGTGVTCTVDGGVGYVAITGGAGAPTAAKYVVGEASVDLSAEIAPASDDQVPVSDSSTAATWRSIPNCTDTTGQHLNYTSSSNTFSCGTTAATHPRENWLLGTMISTGGTTLSAADHIDFRTVVASNGTDCSLDTASSYATGNNVASRGRFTLDGDGSKTYLLRFTPGHWTWSSGAGQAQLSWVDTTGGLPVGAGAILAPTTGTSNLMGQGVFEAVVTPSVDTRYEVRVMFQGGVATHGGTSTGPDAGTFSVNPQAWCERIK